jgi:hypothetical protein
LTHYRYKTGTVSNVNCRDEAGYSDPIALEDDDLIEDEIPEAEGLYYLCVTAGNSATVDATWQQAVDATVVWVQIDTIPLLIPPILAVRELRKEYEVEPIFRVPELVHYVLKIGPPDSTDCSDMTGYRPYRRIPVPIEKNAESPTKVCVIGYDHADNATSPLEKLVGDESAD